LLVIALNWKTLLGFWIVGITFQIITLWSFPVVLDLGKAYSVGYSMINSGNTKLMILSHGKKKEKQCCRIYSPPFFLKQ
jgi:hypothetical protein